MNASYLYAEDYKSTYTRKQDEQLFKRIYFIKF